jgi:hypothetical protein
MRSEDEIAATYDVVEVELMWPQDNIAAAHDVVVRK